MIQQVLLDIFFNNFTSFPVIDEEREHPAFISGNKTFLFGLINSVSAMKCTPAITIISAVVFDASIARAKSLLKNLQFHDKFLEFDNYEQE